jgi:hypothetical protein
MNLLRASLHRLTLLFVFMVGIFLLTLVAGGEKSVAAGDATPTATPAVCDPLLSEGFESGTLGQFTNSVVTCVGGGCDWTASTTSPHSGTHAAFAPDVSNVSDQRLVLSNPIVPNPGSTLTFWHSYDFESFDVNYFDGGVLEASTNGGANWRDMRSNIVSGGYVGTIAYTFENPLEGREAWVGDSGGYIQTVVDLSPYAGQSLLFRFREGTDNSLADVGWHIDDILITGGTCSSVTATPTAPTSTPAPVATCGINSNYAVITSTATIEPGTTDVGNHCDTCNTNITLPFTYRMYGHEFNSANVSSNGMLQFASDYPIGYGPCVPSTFFDYSHAIFPFMSDLRTDYTAEQGIFTSVSGTAPNRIFNIEWRASLYSVNEPVNFEIRLYEGQDRFDIIYGQMPTTYPHYYFALGAQRDNIAYTQYQCDGPAPTSGLMLTFAQPTCVSPTPTIPVTPGEATNTAVPTNTPIATSTRTPAPTATPIPAVCGTLLTEGFESGTLGQFTNSVVICVGGGCGWTASTTSPHSGTHAAFAPDVSNVSDQRLVLSNPITPTADSILTFWHGYDFEGFDVNYFDGGVLEASTNGGANWQDMGANIISGGYVGTIAYTFENPLEGREAWAGDSGGYIQAVVDLSPYAGQSLLFRFREGTDNSLADVGWHIDDILVTGGTACPSPTPVEATNTAIPAEATNTPTPLATSEACTIQFSDVAPADTFYAPIMCLTCMNLISGYSDATFRPYNDVTRGQLAKLVSNTAGFNEPIALARPTFADMPSDNPFYMYVERVASRDIISGYPCGSPTEPCGPENKPYFRPNANATRGQISKIVANAALMNDVPTEQLFEDVPPDHAFYPWIERLAMHNMMGGYQCGDPTEPCGPANKPYFRPFNKATRGQVSKIVANTFYPNCQLRP